MKKSELVEHLVTYQLNMIGKDFSETEKDKEWYCNNRITQEQHKEFAAYAKTQIQKVFKCSKKKAEKEFLWFDLMCGLSIEE